MAPWLDEPLPLPKAMALCSTGRSEPQKRSLWRQLPPRKTVAVVQNTRETAWN